MTMTHPGLPPSWSLDRLSLYARTERAHVTDKLYSEPPVKIDQSGRHTCSGHIYT